MRHRVPCGAALFVHLDHLLVCRQELDVGKKELLIDVRLIHPGSDVHSGEVDVLSKHLCLEILERKLDGL